MSTAFAEMPIAQQASSKPQSKGYESLDIWALAGEQPQRLSSPEDVAIQAVADEREKLARREQEISLKEAQLDKALAACTELVKSVEEDRQAWWKSACKEILETSLHIAEKVVESELHVNPEIVSRCVDTVVAELSKDENRLLVLNPQDMAFLEKEKADWLTNLKKMQGLKIEMNPSVPAGSCYAETQKVRVEAGMSRRLEALWKQISNEDTASPMPVVKDEEGTPT